MNGEKKHFLTYKRNYLWRKKLQDSVEQRVPLNEPFCYKNSDIPAIQNMEMLDCKNSKNEEKDEEKKKSKKKKIESVKRKQVKITVVIAEEEKNI